VVHDGIWAAYETDTCSTATACSLAYSWVPGLCMCDIAGMSCLLCLETVFPGNRTHGQALARGWHWTNSIYFSNTQQHASHCCLPTYTAGCTKSTDRFPRMDDDERLPLPKAAASAASCCRLIWARSIVAWQPANPLFNPASCPTGLSHHACRFSAFAEFYYPYVS